VADRYVVGRVADLPPGGRLLVEVGGRPIGVFNIDGRYYGLINRCPHKGAEMCRGNVVASLSSSGPGQFTYDPDTKLIMCPWHGWEFDVRTGQSYVDPRRTRIRTYDVEVAAGEDVAPLVETGELGLAKDPDRPGPGEFAASGPLEIDETGRAKGPYTAETIEVAVEDDYVVVSLRPSRPARGTRPTRPMTGTEVSG
jgi:nitrite reductase/ring-hydroxylating ferredoxin subunit